MLEAIGCVPDLHTFLLENVTWIRDLLTSTKEEIREQAAVLYAVIADKAFDEKNFETAINYLVSQTNSKSLEAQHGAILGIGNCMERKITTKKVASENVYDWELLKTSFSAISTYFSKMFNFNLLYFSYSFFSNKSKCITSWCCMCFGRYNR